MELKEYLQLIKRNAKIFLAVWLLAIFFPLFFFFLKAQKYETVVSLNVGRKAMEKTENYQYDQYYRLLADEKFSDTVLLWLKDPEAVGTVLEKTGVKKENISWQKLSSVFQGKKLSANYSQLRFGGFNPGQAEKIVQAWQGVLNGKIQELNEKETEGDKWFSVILGKPITAFYAPDYGLIFLVSLIAGFPLAVFGVMFVDYFRKEDENRN